MNTSQPKRMSDAQLSFLLQELGEIMQHAEEDGTQSEPSALVSRLRSLLPTLVDEHLGTKSSSETEKASILRLVLLAVDRFPSVFLGSGVMNPVNTLARCFATHLESSSVSSVTVLVFKLSHALLQLVQERQLAICKTMVSELREMMVQSARNAQGLQQSQGLDQVASCCFQVSRRQWEELSPAGTTDPAGRSTSSWSVEVDLSDNELCEKLFVVCCSTLASFLMEHQMLSEVLDLTSTCTIVASMMRCKGFQVQVACLEWVVCIHSIDPSLANQVCHEVFLSSMLNMAEHHSQSTNATLRDLFAAAFTKCVDLVIVLVDTDDLRTYYETIIGSSLYILNQSSGHVLLLAFGKLLGRVINASTGTLHVVVPLVRDAVKRQAQSFVMGLFQTINTRILSENEDQLDDQPVRKKQRTIIEESSHHSQGRSEHQAGKKSMEALLRVLEPETELTSTDELLARAQCLGFLLDSFPEESVLDQRLQRCIEHWLLWGVQSQCAKRSDVTRALMRVLAHLDFQHAHLRSGVDQLLLGSWSDVALEGCRVDSLKLLVQSNYIDRGINSLIIKLLQSGCVEQSSSLRMSACTLIPLVSAHLMNAGSMIPDEVSLSLQALLEDQSDLVRAMAIYCTVVSAIPTFAAVKSWCKNACIWASNGKVPPSDTLLSAAGISELQDCQFKEVCQVLCLERIADLVPHRMLLDTVTFSIVQGSQPHSAAASLAALGCFLLSDSKEMFHGCGATLMDCLHASLIGQTEATEIAPFAIVGFARPWVLRELFQNDHTKENQDTPSQENKASKPPKDAGVCTLELQLIQELRTRLENGNDPATAATVVSCLGALGKTVQSRQAFLLSILLLISQLDSEATSVNSAAAVEIKAMAQNQGSSAYKVLCGSRPVLEYVVRNLITRPKLLNQLATRVLEEVELNLLKLIVEETLPSLVEQQQTDILVEIARRFTALQGKEMCVAALLVQYGHYAIAEALMGSSIQEIDRLMQYMESVTGWGFISQLEACLPALLRQVTWKLGEEKHASSAQTRERTHDMLQQVAQIITKEASVAGLLKGHFVMLLNSLGDHFKSKKVTGNEALQVVRSLDVLVIFIEGNIVEFVPHVTALLTQATELSNDSSLHHSVLELRQSARMAVVGAWKTFLNALIKHMPAALSRVGPQALVVLLPNFEENQLLAAATSAALDFLVHPSTDNKEHVKNALRLMPPLPSLPETEQITKAIEAERGHLTIHDKLKLLEESLHHESLAVRHAALGEFVALLGTHKGWPSGVGRHFESLPGRKKSSDCSDLLLLENCISTLLRCAGSEARSLLRYKVQLRAAKCLGMIGAADPARLNITTRTPVQIGIPDEALALRLIEDHLSRVLSGASDIDTLDAAAYAIQEILKAEPGASVDTPICLSVVQTPHGALWANLSEGVKEVVRPCLTSNFTLQLKSSTTRNKIPIISSRPMSFRRWILLWIRSLGARATGTKGLLFRACQGVFRHDMTTTLFLLPFIVHNVVLNADEAARVDIFQEIMAVLQGSLPDAPNTPHDSEGMLEVSTHEVFALVDALSTWVEENRSKKEEEKVDDTYVTTLLDAIPAEHLASAAFRVNAHARALKYTEEFLRKKTDNFGGLNPCARLSNKYDDEGVQLLQRVYRGLEDPDSLAGLASLRESGEKIDDRLIIAESTGKWTEALSLYERERQTSSWTSGTLSVDGQSKSCLQQQIHDDGYLRCLLKMGHWSAVMTQANGLMHLLPSRKAQFASRGAEAAWRLGQWDMLDNYLGTPGADVNALRSMGGFGSVIEGEGIRVGKLLQAMRSEDPTWFYEEVKRSRYEAMSYLSAASMDSYERAYPRLVWLQMVQEVEETFELHSKKSKSEVGERHMLRALSKWNERLSATQPSLSIREPILSLRRQLYTFLGLQEEAGSCILEYAKICRKSAHYDAAFMAVSEAEAKGVPYFELEQAKLLWDIGQGHHAISVLHRSLRRKPQAIGRQDAKMLLRLARWAHMTGQMQQDSIISHYKQVIDLEKHWEKGYFYLARYLDELQADAKKRQRDTGRGLPSTSTAKRVSKDPEILERHYLEYLTEVIRNYSHSLKYGHMHIFESLPRMLTLWYDFGAEIARMEGSVPSKERRIATEVMVLVQQCAKMLPVYVWLTALPQLTSHIAHINPDVQKITAHIIGKVLQCYPQQTLWALVAMTKSTVSQRKSSATEIIAIGKKHATTTEGKKVYKQFIPFIEQLIKLCFHSIPRGQKSFSLTNDFSVLKRMMPLEIMMPVLKCLTVELPNDGKVVEGGRPIAPEVSVKIEGFQDEVEVLLSLQRPKKLRLLGTDGIEYTFLCKPKDDLRKDARMMEFTTVLNRLLLKNAQSRRRSMYIRTFGVIPLTEECGLIEWVHNTTGLRHVCQDVYTREGLFDRRRTNPQIKKMYDSVQGGTPSDLLNAVLEMFPPRLHLWLLRMFPEPSLWYTARNNFTRTAAVWSMVGHVVGLGDRHGENILIDSASGDCVHVDFSCLFDKGLALEKPEVVPFRLTQNVVDGFGISGVEGSFTRMCEIALNVLRVHRNTLMSILETFVHDPLVEWTKHTRHTTSPDQADNALARKALATIQGRLDGVLVGVRSTPSLPLSVEGQVHSLISEATSKDNLGKMYIWWMPWF
mmetsp:Transcript_10928/g.67521  ORF Transcript_10928/g.67521 Transcript_10928/m.67521 type:complete len:2630 (+) Transcript_10928:210-8099(+)